MEEILYFNVRSLDLCRPSPEICPSLFLPIIPNKLPWFVLSIIAIVCRKLAASFIRYVILSCAEDKPVIANDVLKSMDAALDGALADIIALHDFKGKKASIIYLNECYKPYTIYSVQRS